MTEPDDLLIGRIAIEMDLVESERVREAVKEQAREDQPRPLGEILVAKGYLTREQLQILLEEQQRRLGLPPTSLQQVVVEEGKPFGKYLLEKQIGAGGTGTVYKAVQSDPSRVVALKILREEDPDDVKRLAREAQTAARLSHPNIVPTYEVGEMGGHHYLAMQYVDGQSLDRVRLDPRHAVEVMRAVADAVQHAHDQGIIHRDLKPQNLMLEPSGHVWVMDFGLARQLQSGSTIAKTGVIQGTPAYMAPEQAQGKKCDERGDVYSMGATLYYLLASRPPFDGLTPLQVIRKAATEEPISPRRFNPAVPREVVSIVLMAMEKEPAQRYPTARTFQEELQRSLDGKPVLSQRRPWFPTSADS